MKILILLALSAILSATATAADADELTSFHTPSKNIHCLAIEGDNGASIDCEVLAKAKMAPIAPRPADCDLEWGNRFELEETGRGYLACTGDTVRDNAGLELEYGKSFTIGHISCTASEKGLECLNAEGHGIFLSKAKQRVF